MALASALIDPDYAKDLSSTLFLSTLVSIKSNVAKPQAARISVKKQSRRPIFISRRRQKKEKYAEIQKLYKKNRQAAYREIFKNTAISEDLSSDQVFAFWTNLVTKTDFSRPVISYDFMASPVDINDLPSEIGLMTPDEVRSSKLPHNSAYGPDGVTVNDLNKISIHSRCQLYSTWLLLRWVPSYVLDSRTIFLPKK